MSIPEEHLGLFKADWIGDPGRLKTLARRNKYNDLFTAEIAAWCAEVHEHLRDLEGSVGVELLLGSMHLLAEVNLHGLGQPVTLRRREYRLHRGLQLSALLLMHGHRQCFPPTGSLRT